MSNQENMQVPFVKQLNDYRCYDKDQQRTMATAIALELIRANIQSPNAGSGLYRSDNLLTKHLEKLGTYTEQIMDAIDGNTTKR